MTHYPGMELGFIRNKVGYIGTVVESVGDSVIMAVSGDIDVDAEMHRVEMSGQTFTLKFL